MAFLQKRETAQKDFGLIGHRSALVGKGDTVSDAFPELAAACERSAMSANH
jgi:hypothetical protein